MKQFSLLNKVSNDLILELEINEEHFLMPTQYLGFNFKNLDNNQTLSFEFEAAKHKELIFGFIRSKNSGINEHLLVNKFKNKFQENFKSSEAWSCFHYYNEFRNWEDLNTLQKLQFGNFEEDLRDKLQLIMD